MRASSRSKLPVLGITTGDPAGIGPEISLRAIRSESFAGGCRILLFGDGEILQSVASDLDLRDDLERLTPEDLATRADLPMRGIVHVPARSSEIVTGRGSRASGESAARNIIECARACGESRVSSMVTAPIHKQYLREAGYSYPGHTEFLADLTNTTSVAMAFLTDRLKVVLVTIHLPLRAAIEAITPSAILEKLEITLREFARLGLPCRRVAVAGMNPHAGEAGLLGSEEREIIGPAVDEARRQFPSSTIEGPLPADTVFYRAHQGEFDVVLALFHDQGLAPIKLVGFGEAVNVTLGLPFVRTSVDHGTAYDIAGKGVAKADSMEAAIRWALRLTVKR